MTASASASKRRFERYVAIGDSSTEGLDDPDGAGGYRGWADRLAQRIARAQGSLLYANLGIRGRRTRSIRQDQIEPALAMRPDLTTLFCGTNDVVARRFDLAEIAGDIEGMQRTLTTAGATVLTFTLPDLTPIMPLGHLVSARVDALNARLREIAGRTGAVLVDFTAYPVASDPRLWSTDRLHANSYGHERIAAALADALGIPGADRSWAEPLPEMPRLSPWERLSNEGRWIRGHLLPWAWRHLRARSSGDGVTPKRPKLAPVELAEALGRGLHRELLE